MYKPKEDIYNALSVLEAEVYQARPEVLNTFPCLTFHILDNVPEYTIDKEIGFQEIVVAVDIYARTSEETSGLLEDVEVALRELDYRLTFSMDIPEDGLSHITSRFNLRGK